MTADGGLESPREVWRFLDHVRRRRRRAIRGRLAYLGYVIVLAAAVYGGPIAIHVAHSLASARHDPRTTGHVRAALPCCLAGVLLVAQLTIVRQAAWRGPVLVSAADGDWLLPLPLPRRQLLRPRFDAAVAVGVVVAAAAGVIEALVLHGYGLGSLAALTAAGAGGFALLAVMTLSIAVYVERSAQAARVVTAVTPGIAAFAAVTVGVGIAHVGGYGATWPDAVLVWLSPGGWVAQLTDRAAHGHVGAWMVAVALLAVTAVAAQLRARSVAVTIPAHELRRRASTAGSMRAAAFLGEFRQARLAVQRARSRPGARKGRKPPRLPGGSVPWRDFTWLSRSPAAAAWTVALLAAAALAVRVAMTDQRPSAGDVAVGAACMLGYVAALQLTEPSRLDADDLRRTRWSPYRTASLAWRHTFLPVCVLIPAGLIITGSSAPWLSGRETVTAIVAACILPPILVAAATLNSYRGRAPLQLIFYGGDLGFGSVGPLLLLAWYLYGVLSAVIGGELALTPLTSATRRHSAMPTAIVASVITSAGVTAIVLFATGWRARRLARNSS